MSERFAISLRVTKDLHRKMEASKDMYFEELQQTDSEARNSWKNFVVMLYRNWLKEFTGSEEKASLFFNLGKKEK